MKITSINKDTNVKFKGIWNNKAVLKGLEKISEHGSSFVAATTFVMATGIRPIAINLTPNVKKENKQYATTNSITSGLIKFGIAEAIAIPVEKAVKQIDKNPEKYLNPKTIKALQGNAKTLLESKNYRFATQLLKLGTGFISAIPKAMLTVAFIPLVKNLLFPKKEIKILNYENNDFYNEYNPVFSPEFGNSKSISFKGNLSNITSKGIGKLLDNTVFQNIVKKFSINDTNIARNVSMATDILLTTSFIHQTKRNKKIKEERKNALIWNNIISTGLTLIGGFSIDKLIQKETDKFIKKFSEINKNDPKLHKYIEGINILRPTLIFAVIYYAILPVISTYIADKTDEIIEKEKEK